MKDPYVVIDIETNSLNPYTCKIVNIGCWRSFNGQYYSNRTVTAWSFVDCLSDPDIAKVFQNAKFDLHVLRSHGYKVAGPIHDTMLLAKTFRNDLPSYALEPLAYYFFGDPCMSSGAMDVWFQKHGFKKDERDMSEPPEGLLSLYLKGDVMRTARLFRWLYPKVMRDPGMRFLYETEIKAMRETLEVERNGIGIDRKKCQRLQKSYGKEVADLEREIGINPRPSRQLRDYLRDSHGRLGTTPTGLVSTDEAHLREYLKRKEDPIIRKVLRVREITKQLSTYVTNLLEVTTDEKPTFHPSFMQSFAITRRFSSRGWFGSDGQRVRGNTQNIPPAIRRVFIAPQGYRFAVLDLSQIESRLWAVTVWKLLGDDTWVRKYNEDPTFNMYLDVARLCLGHGITKKDELYDIYKAVVLARYYGSGIETFAAMQGIPIPKAAMLFRQLDQRVPQIRRLQQRVIQIVRSRGYVKDGFGSRYYVEPQKAYTAVDYICQGWAGTINKMWLVETGEHIREWKCPDFIINHVHDELDLYVRADGSESNRCQQYCDLLMPLKEYTGVEIRADYNIDDNWEDAK